MPKAENNDYKKGRSHLAAIPVDEQHLAPYIDDFDFVFSEDRVRNIALSGPFAAGKSSVMLGWEEYEARNRSGNQSTYIHVSLAEDAVGPKAGSREIESRLVNQLVQKIDPKKIKRTGLKRYEDLNSKTAIIRSCMFGAALLLIALLVYLFGFENWLFAHPLRSKIIVIALIIAASVAVFFVQTKTSLFSQVKKISVKGYDIELFDKADSALDRYVDDVVYLIKNSGFSVFVFEDLDRFDEPSVFVKLSAVNELVNSVGNGKPIRFFYLVKDDMFVAENRTKFFDYIIPVAPYVDANNSFEILKGKLRDAGIPVSDAFLFQLSIFVSNSRILLNIVNESLHYAKVSGIFGDDRKTEDGEKLVALMAYKSLLPHDFALLQDGKGYLYALLEESSKAMEAAREAMDADIVALHEHSVQHGMTDDLEYDIASAKEARNRISRKNLEESLEWAKFDRDDFLRLRDAEGNRMKGREGVDVDAIERSGYLPLVEMLVMHGYIDESYDLYVSNFYEGVLSKSDKAELSLALQGRPIDPSHRYDNPSAIIERVGLHLLHGKGFRNFSLMSDAVDLEERAVIMKGIAESSDTKTIVDFTLSGFRSVALLSHAVNLYPGLIARAIGDDSLDMLDRRHFTHMVICAVDEIPSDSFLARNIKKFAESDESFACISATEDALTIADTLEAIGYEMSRIALEGADEAFLKAVIEKGMFAPAVSVLSGLAMGALGLDETALAPQRFLDSLYQLKDTALGKKAADAMDGLVKSTVDSLVAEGEKASFRPDSICWCLNCIDDEDMRLALAKLADVEEKIDDICSLDDDALWGYFVERGWVLPDAVNAASYYDLYGFDESLLFFLECEGFEGSFAADIFDDSSKSQLDSFMRDLARCEELKEDVFLSLVASSGYSFASVSGLGLGAERLAGLVDQGLLAPTEENLSALRESCANDVVVAFAAQDVEAYLGLISGRGMSEYRKLQFVEQEIEELLAVDSVTSEEKISILNKAGTVSPSRLYSPELNNLIVREYLDDEDVSSAIHLFGSQGEAYDSTLVETCSDCVEQILNEEICLPYPLLERILKTGAICSSEAHLLIKNSINEMDSRSLASLLDCIGDHELAELISVPGKRWIQMKRSAELTLLLERLDSRNYIKSFNEPYGVNGESIRINSIFWN